jgi:hypothetical protein
LNFVRHGSRANKFLDDVLTSRRISNGAKVGGVLLLHRCAVHSNWSLRRRTLSRHLHSTLLCTYLCRSINKDTHSIQMAQKLKICNN